MLARENRLVSADDFRSTMKNGRRASVQHLVVYLKRDEALPRARFGFVVAKSIGGAVQRNLVKRRLRSIAREVLTAEPAAGAGAVSGAVLDKSDIVVRALPGAAELPWPKLREELIAALSAAAGSKARS